MSDLMETAVVRVPGISLSDLFRDHATESVRKRGDACFQQGRVELTAAERGAVSAFVSGSSKYSVYIDLADMYYDCTCPYHRQEPGVCKHIWATLRAVEGQVDVAGVVPSRPADGPIKVIADEIAAMLPSLGGGQASPAEVSMNVDAVPDDLRPAVVAELWRRMCHRDRQPTSPSSQAWARKLLMLRPNKRPVATSAQAAAVKIHYLVHMDHSARQGAISMELVTRRRRKDGQWGKPQALRLSGNDIATLDDPGDRYILRLAHGASETSYSYGWGSMYVSPNIELDDLIGADLVERACRTGRCSLAIQDGRNEQYLPANWDDGEPWRFQVQIVRDEHEACYRMRGVLRRGEQTLSLDTPRLITGIGLVFTDTQVARLDDGNAFSWMAMLREEGELSIPLDDLEPLRQTLSMQVALPPLDAPEELRIRTETGVPDPCLHVTPPDGGRDMHAQVMFKYHDVATQLTCDDPRPGIATKEKRIMRDFDIERQHLDHLASLGLTAVSHGDPGVFGLPAKRFAEVTRSLLDDGWRVTADGKPVRASSMPSISVSSGIDWFEVDARVAFDGHTVELPELLRAIRGASTTVTLDDGSIGMLPEDWLKRFGTLADMGQTSDGRIRFKPTQTALLDALLADAPGVDTDARFDEARQRLASFAGVEPLAPAASFVGELRPYQKDALGWFEFLRTFGFGGCLADDMGLGKTVQVLAMLTDRRAGEHAAGKPSLIVVPRSLIFNWTDEAARFSPHLRVCNHTGVDRMRDTDGFDDYDIVLTTYGTLRRDAPLLKDYHFDYVILDESQAIKNPQTAAAKAARLLRGEHRLALSGTPIENHLGELWSLFEFLNPGMLGRSSAFTKTTAWTEDDQRLIARAVRPFVLRRTKQQVAADLPERVEQTVYCELPARQRKLYDELRDHYRAQLLSKVADGGLNRAKIQVLEALLRLRQAACHPGLIDSDLAGHSSAKLDMLFEEIESVRSEGHKALVFSQFTKLLAIVREKLDRQKVTYAYLDGRTRDRAAKVEQFQNDDSCSLFLISLKAGGVGLNLTSAGYVFLLDPWWNPAVEAQAIDRAHRIGQTQRVIAKRLIARDTVEEKVLEMQSHKRELADAVIRADQSLIKNLTRDDLELLLG